MTSDRIGALEALLAETQTAHGVFEATDLDGVYDEAWPHWYAQYAVDHGIGELLGRSITADELASSFASWWTEGRQAGASPPGPWPSATARRLAAEYPGGDIEP